MYYSLFIIIAIIFVIIILLFNSIIKYKNKVKQAKSGIDVYLNQRFDLIPNLIETVKAYKKYESEIITNITKLRTSYINNKNDLETKTALNKDFNNILAVAESYPELKASEQFLNLQKNLSKMENQLQAARRIYNSEVTAYNTKIGIFPFNIIAKIFNFKEEKLFEIEAGKENNINVKNVI